MKLMFGFLCVGLLCSTAFAQDDQNEIRCLKSVGLKTSLRLQFEFPGSNKLGYVTYEHGSGKISVKQLITNETKRSLVGLRSSR